MAFTDQCRNEMVGTSIIVDRYFSVPPLLSTDLITTDATKTIVSNLLRTDVGLMGIKTTFGLVEAALTNSIVKRYHVSLNRFYRTVCAEAPSIRREMALEVLMKALNDSTGQDDLVPTLLVYEALPSLWLPIDRPSPVTYN